MLSLSVSGTYVISFSQATITAASSPVLDVLYDGVLILTTFPVFDRETIHTKFEGIVGSKELSFLEIGTEPNGALIDDICVEKFDEGGCGFGENVENSDILEGVKVALKNMMTLPVRKLPGVQSIQAPGRRFRYLAIVTASRALFLVFLPHSTHCLR